MPLSKPFVVATEGQTIDGRQITREQIQQMAANYDPKVYTAVANLEHYLSFMPESTFSAQGHVVSLTTQETTLMGDKKLQLMAVVDANDSVVSLQKKGQKAFASIELVNNFINKGITYLTGLAFTDSPASIGTQSMKFSAKPENIYSFGEAVSIEFEPEASTPGLGESLFNKVKELLTGKGKKDEERFTDVGLAVLAIAASQRELLDKYSELAKANETIATLQAQADKDRTEFAEFKAQVDAMPDGTSQRPPASGGNGANKTDC
ncbi:MAG: GPO family capsid scaffolding protein [Nitrosomonadales bacterium]|nr:GPO family capsid scaffolding protein [Nitrosomonadales bacterium]